VLWDAVRTDVLSAISTDHCAFNWQGQKTLGEDDFSKIPNGGPGLENRTQMIHTFGVPVEPTAGPAGAVRTIPTLLGSAG
jgi:dihydropyrimidinase